MPMPVLAGIGHERDNTIIDEEAHRFDTPSKVVGYIGNLIVQNARAAAHALETLGSDAERLLETAERRVEALETTVVERSERMLAAAATRVDTTEAALFEAATRTLDRTAERVDAMVKEMVGLGPEATLKRGFAVVRNAGTRRPVSTAEEARRSGRLELMFRDGCMDVLPDAAPAPKKRGSKKRRPPANQMLIDFGAPSPAQENTTEEVP